MTVNKYFDPRNVLRIQRFDLTNSFERSAFVELASGTLLARLGRADVAGEPEVAAFARDIQPPSGVRRAKGLLAFSDVPDESAFCGFATMHEFRRGSHATPQLYLGFLAVHPEHVGHGVDAALLTSAIDPYDAAAVVHDPNGILPDFVSGRIDSVDGNPTRPENPPATARPAENYPQNFEAKSIRRLAYTVVPALRAMNIGQGFTRTT